MRRIIIRIGVVGLMAAFVGCKSSSSDKPSARAAESARDDSAPARPVNLTTYASPEAAMTALADAGDSDDYMGAERILGSEAHEIVASGDDDADREDCHRTAAMIRESLRFEDAGAGRKIALVGNDAWRFPVPLVAASGGWKFDVATGKNELHSRRIGRNELFVVEALRDCIEAQEEYRAEGRDEKRAACAQRFMSHEGRHDGLYWPTKGDEPKSPVGPFIAAAAFDDDRPKGADVVPFHGYYFRVLCHQGKCAPGGEKSYVDKDGLMTHGCAIVAWPASYGESGIMTFVARDGGVVLEKDLGAGAKEPACPLACFDPDAKWSVVKP